MSENEFLNALKEEMPEDFGRELLAQLKAEDPQKAKPFPAFWTVAAASIVTVLVGMVLFMSRVPNSNPLSTTLEAWQVREPITPENIDRLQPLANLGQGYATAMALSPDDNTLAVATTNGIFLHNAHDLNAEPRAIGMPEEIRSWPFNAISYLAYSADGRLFVGSANADNFGFYQWDETRQIFSLLYETDVYRGMIQKLQLSPDGTKLLLAGCMGESSVFVSSPSAYYCLSVGNVRVEIIDLASQTRIVERQLHGVSNAVVAINPDWTKLAYQENLRIQLLDIASNETVEILRISRNTANVSEFALNEMHEISFSPDGTIFGLRSVDTDNIYWWQLDMLLSQEQPIIVPKDGDTYPSTVNNISTFNPVADKLVVGWRSGVRIYDYFEPSASSNITSDMKPRSIAISTDGQRIYALGDSGLIRVWDWNSLESIDYTVRYGLNSSSVFAISADSQSFVNDSYYSQSVSFIWNMRDGLSNPLPLQSDTNGYAPSTYMVISRDGRYIAYYQNYALWVYDRQANETRQLTTIPSSFSPPDPVQLAFMDEGSLLLAKQTGGYGEIARFSPEMLATGDVPYPVPTIRLEALSSVDFGTLEFSLVFSPDGRTAVTFQCPKSEPTPACENAELRVFDTTTGEEISRLDSQLSTGGRFLGFDYSADSQWLSLVYCNVADYEWDCTANNIILDIWQVDSLSVGSDLVVPVLHLDIPEIQAFAFVSLDNLNGNLILTSLEWEPLPENPRYGLPLTSFWHITMNGEVEKLSQIEAENVNFAPDGTYALVSSRGQVQLWGVPASVASGN